MYLTLNTSVKNEMLMFEHYFSILKSESLAIADLGAAIYDALDYSLGRDEQRTLSGSLENLIDKMTSADEDCEDGGDDDDEGIDDYEGVIKQSGQCTMVLDLCRYTPECFFVRILVIDLHLLHCCFTSIYLFISF